MARARRRTQLGQAVSQTKNVPAPVGGLNTVNSIAQMPETDAVILENWFPTPTDIEIRNGYVKHVTGIPAGYVETLMNYASPTTTKLFAINKPGGTANVYDVTSSGAVGAAVLTGLTNARWEYVNFNNTGGAYLYMANGVDKPYLYNGSTWTAIDGASTPAITGVTTTKLRNPAVWKNRLWFVEDGTCNAWHLPLAAIGGAAQSIPLGAVFKMGGQLQTIFTVSIDNASSIDDYIAFLSSEGEIALYRGSDPSSAGLFGLVGLYRAGRPIGRRHVFRYGADTVLLTIDGVVTMSKLLMSNRDNMATTLSYKIQPSISNDASAYSGNFGWQGILHPAGDKILINVPQQENITQYQYVMNTIHGSWTKYTGWNAACFELSGDKLFFGCNGFVAQCDTGASDAGDTIQGIVKPAFSYFGSTQQKSFKLMRPIFSTNGALYFSVATPVDFSSDVPQTYPAVSNSISAAPWDTSPWDVTSWSGDAQIQKNWVGMAGIGFSATSYILTASDGLSYKLLSIDYVFETGGLF